MNGTLRKANVGQHVTLNGWIQKRRDFEQTSDDKVRKRMDGVTEDMYKRKSPFVKRREAQKAHLDLPKFPTTTIGSFPVCVIHLHPIRLLTLPL